ncbi:MAG: hypothetical protein WBP64_07605 [Nitrososphaeraceae archaeon]
MFPDYCYNNIENNALLITLKYLYIPGTLSLTMTTSGKDNTYTKDRLKITSLLREYSELRAEVRIFGVLGIICVSLSVLTSTTILGIALLFKERLLFFVSPAVSLFFVIVAMALSGYIITLEVRLSHIEDNVNKIIGGPPVIRWEKIGGIFFRYGKDQLIKQAGKYWGTIFFIGIGAGLVPFILSLGLGIYKYSNDVGFLAWLTMVGIIYGAVAVITIYIGYWLYYKHRWEDFKFDV